MGPFALSVPAYRLRTQRKRKRPDDDDDDDAAASSTPHRSDRVGTPSSSSRLPSSSINPRSHGPDTLRQFAVAGLSPDEDLPSNTHPNFPHAPIPRDSSKAAKQRKISKMASATSGSEADVDTDASDSRRRSNRPPPSTRNYPERLRHLNTMTVILHRSIHDGDMAHAKRAFGLLLRTRDVDIRLNDMWAIGAEILMRDGENDPARPGMDGAAGEERENVDLPARWGLATNVGKVKSYLENLILQHPHQPYFPRLSLTTAMDFWPALFSIEIYNVDAEFKRTLHLLEEESEGASGDDNSMFDDDGTGSPGPLTERRRAARKRAATDEIRRETRKAALEVAARMDVTMESSPYDKHAELLRLRGMLALFIGDLFLPSKFVDNLGLEKQLRGLSLSEDLRREAGHFEDREAITRREAELRKAREYLGRAQVRGCRLEPWLQKVLDLSADDELQGADSSMIELPPLPTIYA